MPTRKTAAFLIGIFVLSGWQVGGPSRLLSQETQGGSSISVREARQIDSVFASLDHTRSPGCALGVLKDGSLAFARGYGMANLDHSIAITPKTVFRTGSVSKQFTSAVVVLLAREGAFSLDDDIRTYFPELLEFGAPITIRQLLNHTSGIRDYLELMGMRGVGDESTYTEEDVVELLARQKGLNFQPGSDHLYSNSGYLLLSRLVERTTGKSLREQAQARIFEPLGMTASHYHDDHREIVPFRATGYGLSTEGFVVDQTTLDIVGDGGVFTSIEELSKWMANFWTLTVGGEDWLATLETRGVLTSGDTLDYAMGLVHGTQRGVPSVGHGGSFVGYRAATLRYPEEQLGIMVLCNYALTNPMAMARNVGEVLLNDRMAPPETSDDETPPPQRRPSPPTLTPEQEAELVGEYYSQEVDATFRVSEGERGLVVNVNGVWEFPLRPQGPDLFRAEFLNLTFLRESGRIISFTAGSGRAGGVLFERR